MIIIMVVFLVLLNIAMGLLNYKIKNYKTAMFNCFAAGVILGALIIDKI